MNITYERWGLVKITYVFCDNCNEIVWDSQQGTVRAHDDFTHLPVDIENATAGESGTVCWSCQEFIDKVSDKDDPTFAGAHKRLGGN